MLFNSLYFVAFAAVVLVIHHGVVRSWTSRKRFLLAASWLFYATWSPSFLAILVATTWIDFLLAGRIRAVQGTPRARVFLVISLTLNLGVLAVFKYGRFLYDSADALLGLPAAPHFLSLVVPLGISFYTFHSISYVVDTYRGLRPPTDDFADFALYVAFFPQLVAGPITRWGFFGPQLERPRTVTFEDVDRALFLLAVGYVKKVVCADSLGSFVDRIYDDAGATGAVEAWLALYAYAFQIYFDFSGYTDIAWGIAGLLGFRLPENFRHPYLAESPSEFWRRWHVSLSTWLRDYLYIPLGGNRRGRVRTYVNLMLTMLLGGLWHGAAWTFVLWGGYHGAWLAAHRFVSRADGPPRTPPWLRRVVSFHLIALGWVLFRAGRLEVALAFFRGLVTPRVMSGPFPVAPVALVAFGCATHALALRSDRTIFWQRLPRTAQGVAYAVVLVLVGLFSAESARFIYFQF